MARSDESPRVVTGLIHGEARNSTELDDDRWLAEEPIR
jgi:hypothetical protein